MYALVFKESQFSSLLQEVYKPALNMCTACHFIALKLSGGKFQLDSKKYCGKGNLGEVSHTKCEV